MLVGVTLPFYFDSYCLSIVEYLSLFLSSAAARFTSLALNAVKSSISFGRIKRQPEVWWSAEVVEAVSERRKTFAAAHKSDKDRQAYIYVSLYASCVIAKGRLSHGSTPSLCGWLFFLIFLLS